MSLGEKLKAARERKKLTQEQVAELVGVKKNTITGYEKNNRQPDVIMLKKLISVLDVQSSELLEMPDFDDSVNVCKITFSDQAQRIAAIYDSLKPAGKELLDTVATFAEKNF